MRLSQWAEKQGVCYRTARRWFDEGKVPGAIRISERIILVPDAAQEQVSPVKSAVIYARVSSNDQMADLERQAERLTQYATSSGYVVERVVKEVASGMNPRRKRLIEILQDPAISTIIVENRDRLARMNADLIIASSHKEIIVVNQVEPDHNDFQDVVDFLMSVCARQYGKRLAKSRAERHAREVLNV